MEYTIRDVARKANVSIATVSRVLNDIPIGYSQETKDRVLKAVEELKYRPNAVARGLINKRTTTIGVLLPDVSSLLAVEILNGVEDVAESAEHSVIVCNTAASGVKTMKYLEVLKEKRVDGIVFVSELMTEDYYNMIQSMKIPVVLVSTFSHRHQLPYVRVDDQQASYKATEYLVRAGHTKIGMISGPISDPVAGFLRVQGFRQAFLDYNLELCEGRIVCGDSFAHHTGYECIDILMRAEPDTTAVFAASDELAAGVLSWAYQNNVDVPNQLSVIGYDNTKIAEMVTPPLTVVAQPLFDLGRVASETLLKAIDGERVESRVLPFSIVERATVKMIKP